MEVKKFRWVLQIECTAENMGQFDKYFDDDRWKIPNRDIVGIIRVDELGGQNADG